MLSLRYNQDIMNGLIAGFKGYFKAYRFIKEHNLWRFVVFPGIINIAMLIMVVWGAMELSSYLLKELFSYFDFFDFLPKFLKSGIDFALGLLVKSLVITVYFIFYKNLVLIIMSPLMSYLAEIVHEIRSGEEKDFDLEQFIKDVVRGIRIAVRNILLEFLWIILFALLGFIPIVGLAAPFCLFIIQFYYFGFSMLDYCLESRSMTYRESVRTIQKNKGLAIGNGAGFYLLMIIPFVGWMFAPAFGVVSAYLSSEDRI